MTPCAAQSTLKTKQWSLYRDLDQNSGDGVPDKGSNNDQPSSGSFTLTGDAGTTHTLTMFYMERGLNASNLRITFNFPQQNLLKVTKEVDTSAVNQEVFGAVMDNLGNFEMFLDTQATSGQPLAVQNSAGYVATKSRTLYDPALRRMRKRILPNRRTVRLHFKPTMKRRQNTCKSPSPAAGQRASRRINKTC